MKEWHDELDRYAKTGKLDPPDQCLCEKCLTKEKETDGH